MGDLGVCLISCEKLHIWDYGKYVLVCHQWWNRSTEVIQGHYLRSLLKVLYNLLEKSIDTYMWAAIKSMIYGYKLKA